MSFSKPSGFFCFVGLFLIVVPLITGREVKYNSPIRLQRLHLLSPEMMVMHSSSVASSALMTFSTSGASSLFISLIFSANVLSDATSLSSLFSMKERMFFVGSE